MMKTFQVNGVCILNRDVSMEEVFGSTMRHTSTPLPYYKRGMRFRVYGIGKETLRITTEYGTVDLPQRDFIPEETSPIYIRRRSHGRQKRKGTPNKI